MTVLWYYRKNKLDFGPFSSEERAEIDSTARAPVEWRAEDDPDMAYERYRDRKLNI